MLSAGLAFFALSLLSRSLVNSASLKKKIKETTDCFPSSFQCSRDFRGKVVKQWILKTLKNKAIVMYLVVTY